MNDGSSTTSPALLAEWNHDPSCSLRMCQGCSLQTVGMLWAELFTNWPQSATTSHGGLFRQPPLAHPIDASDGGDLLGNPRTSTKNGASSVAVAKSDHRHRLEAQIAMMLLPTPLAGDSQINATPSRANRNSPGLGAIAMLLPTPTAQAAKHGSTRDLTAKSHGHNLWDIPHTITDDTPPQSNVGN